MAIYRKSTTVDRSIIFAICMAARGDKYRMVLFDARHVVSELIKHQTGQNVGLVRMTDC